MVFLHDSIAAHDMIGLKVRAAEGGKPLREVKSGEELHRDSGEWRSIKRTVDRKTDRYRETVTRPDGEIVRNVDEKLSEHRGHGNAARKPPAP